MNNGNFKVIPRASLPPNTKVLPIIWQMKHKWDILINDIKKYKARLNVNVLKMNKGIHFNKTYAPVAS